MSDVETVSTSEARTQSRGRTAAMWVLLALAGLLLLLSSFAVWVNRVALNTQTFTDTSSELLADDAIRSAVATRAVDELYASVDVQAEIESQLPKDFKSLAGLASAGVRQASYQVVDRALEQPSLQKLFAVALEQAHSTLVDVLEGGGDRASTAGGVVTLDLGQIVLETADRIGIRSQIEDKLPANVGQIEVLRSDQLDTAQNVFQLLKTLAWFLPVLTLVCLGAAVWVARDRRRAIRGFGIVAIVVGVLGLVAANVTGGYVVDSLVKDRDTRIAAGNAWDILTVLMRGSFRWLVFVGVLIVVGAVLAGPGRRALAARGWLAPALRERVWAYVALGVFVLVLLLMSPTLDFVRLLWLVLILALGALWIETMRTMSLHEFPDAGTPAVIGETRARMSSWWSDRAAARAAAPAMSTAAATDVSARLAGLAELHAKGELTDEEYASAKAQVLAGS
jgi:hypothetical protein